MNTEATRSKLKHIHNSFQAASDALPAYRHMLPFFESLFTLQEAAAAGTSPETAEISPELPADRGKSRMPLIDRSRLSSDTTAALDLLQRICLIAAAEGTTPQLAAGANKLSGALEKESALIKRAVDLFMRDDRPAMQDLSVRLSLDESILLFYIYHSTWPAIARQAAMIPDAELVSPDQDQGCCPVCGGAPGLAILMENGARVLVCGFCRRQWPFKRILCPSCGNADAKTLNYFFSEEEPAYRVYTCDACKKYIKTIDTRHLARPLYPPLESIVTTHLDLQAREMGYSSTASDSLHW